MFIHDPIDVYVGFIVDGRVEKMLIAQIMREDESEKLDWQGLRIDAVRAYIALGGNTKRISLKYTNVMAVCSSERKETLHSKTKQRRANVKYKGYRCLAGKQRILRARI